MDIIIRKEIESDYRKVEELTRKAFWNLYVPGCDEHYLVHILRDHPDFLGYLDLVAIQNDKVVGNIMFTKSYIEDESGNKMDTITFGPVAVLPEFQKQGVGWVLIQQSIKIAAENNHKVIIIQGHPHNYCKHGFKSSRDFNITDSEGKYPYSLLVLELEKGILDGHTWKYFYSKAFELDKNASEEYDKQFEPKEKKYTLTQEEFSIAFRAYLL